MDTLKKFGLWIAKFFICILFIMSALNKIFNWQKAEIDLINVFYDWQMYLKYSTSIQQFFSGFIAWAEEILIVVVVLEFIAAIMIFMNWKPKIAAFFLIVFFLPATILLHPFWFLEGSLKEMQMVMFFKNLAISSSLIYISVFGIKKEEMMPLPPMPKND